MKEVFLVIKTWREFGPMMEEVVAIFETHPAANGYAFASNETTPPGDADKDQLEFYVKPMPILR